MVARGNGATRIGRLTLLSPAVLLKNALGFTLVTGTIPASISVTWTMVAVVIAGALAVATWVFLRLQGVETWEATRRQAWAVTAAITSLCIVPVLLADANYDVAAPRPNAAPAIPQLFARGNGSFALVDTGAPMPVRCCGTILNRDLTPVGTDEDTRQDLLILLPVETSRAIADVSLRLDGQAGLTVVADPVAVASATQHLEAHSYAEGTGPVAPDGHRISDGWIVRVPVAVHPSKPWDIGGNRYPLNVAATYTVAGEPPRTLMARTAVNAQVSSGIYEMAMAGSIIPVFCFGASLMRWRRTR
jgi:hypothetical protein